MIKEMKSLNEHICRPNDEVCSLTDKVPNDDTMWNFRERPGSAGILNKTFPLLNWQSLGRELDFGDEPTGGRMPRRHFIKTSASVALGLTCGLPVLRADDSKRVSRPNILWITMEDTCSQFLGCYGNPSARTPNMNRLAARGVRFKKAFSTAPVCSPSRSTIITGCLPGTLGTGHHRSRCPIPDLIKGFPYYLRQAGYFTSNNLKTDYNLSQTQHFVDEAWDECFGAGGWGTNYGNNRDSFDESGKEAGWWHRKRGQPFFAIFNLMNSHQSRTMTFPHEWYVENVLNKLPAVDRIQPENITVPPFYRDTPEMRRDLCRVYNSLQLTDRELGRILDRLEQDGLADDTIIFCFADHGEGIPRCKTSAIGTGFQVPFFISLPPKFQHLSPWKSGEVTDELVSSSEDVAPTVLSLADVEIPRHMTGRPLLGGARRAPRSYVWGDRNRIDESPDLSRVVTDGRFFYTRVFMPQLPLVKYFKYNDVSDIMRTIRADYQAGKLNEEQAALVEPQQPVEYLFDLDNDPWQIRNLAGDAKFKPDLERLRRALQAHLKEIRDIHFMPESEMIRRSKKSTPCEFRLDDQVYPFERVLAAANLVGMGSSAIASQFELLKDEDATVRYWGAIGLDAQGDAIKLHEKKILAALNDADPSTQIVLAGIAFKQFQNDRGREILEHWLQNDDRWLVLQAEQTIEYMREQGAPFALALRKLLQRQHDNNNAGYDVQCAAETTLHFLEGAPLYYEGFKRWTPKSQMLPNPSVHF